MRDIDRVFELRKRIIDDWRWRGLSWEEIVHKYGVSKAWFYKLRKRFLKDGYDGLRDKVRSKAHLSHTLGYEQKLKILDYIYDNPTHGPDRIARELDLPACPKTVWNILKNENLNTRRRRRLWAEDQGKPTLTTKERLQRTAKKNHVMSSAPGELVSIDTFMVCIKGLGRLWQWTACDTYSSYGWAKLYFNKTTDETVDFLENHILKNIPRGKIKRILTDQGTEFYLARHKKHIHRVNKVCRDHNIIHSITKPAHPWTNGYAERLNQTIWQEFYLCRLTRPFNSLEELQKELHKFMRDYNFKRKHTGYKLNDAGYHYPAHAFFDINESARKIKVT